MNALLESFIDQNWKNGVQNLQKWQFLAKKQVFRPKSLVKTKLFDLESSFMAQNIHNYMHLMMHELTKNFFANFGSGTPWILPTGQNGIQIPVWPVFKSLKNLNYWC